MYLPGLHTTVTPSRKSFLITAKVGYNGSHLSLVTQPESPGELTVVTMIAPVVVRTLNMRSTLITKMLSAPYHVANSRHNVVEQISTTYPSCLTETVYQY